MTDSNNYTVLIVEDTVELANMTRAVLKRFGFQTHHVEEAETALVYLQDTIPDLILLDLNLPGMNGWDFLQQAVELYGDDAFKVIVTTAYGDNANRLVGKMRAVQRYMVKPYSPSELIAAVREALQIEQPSG